GLSKNVLPADPPAVSYGNPGFGGTRHYESFGRRAIRTALEKSRTSSSRWLTARNVLVTRPHLGLEVSRFDTVSTEYETISPSWTGCGQRMSLKPGDTPNCGSVSPRS